MAAPSTFERVTGTGWGFLIGFVLTVLAVGAFAWVVAAGPEDPSIIDLQFAGDSAHATALLSDGDDVDDLRSSVARDWALIVAYVAAIGWWCVYGWRHFRMPYSRRVAAVLAGAVVVAGIADAVENLLSRKLLDERGADDTLARWTTAMAIPKWAILLTALPIALAAVATGGARVVRRVRRCAGNGGLPVLSAGPDGGWKNPGDKSRCEWNMTTPPPVKGARDPLVGMCFSGGGIRSATFNMGALQVLSGTAVPAGIPHGTEKSVLERTDLLTCVSGGAYIAGALQLLADEHRDDDAPPTFQLCSPEENHVRLHGRYLADNLPEWIGAIARVLSGTVLNLLVFSLVLFVVARPLGWATHELLFHVDDSVRDLTTTDAMWWAAAWPAIVGLVVLLAATVIAGDAGTVRMRVQLLAFGFLTLAIVVLLLVWLLPTLARLVPQWVANLGDLLPWQDDAPEEGGATVLFVTAGGSLAASALAIINRPTPAPETAKPPKWPAFATLRKWIGAALPYVAGLLLFLIALAAFAMFLSQAAIAGSAGERTFFGIDGQQEVRVWAVTAALLALLYLVADQTRWSLGPFYRRRLASAFAISVQGQTAREKPWNEPTTISKVAVPHRKLPQVLVCAAANVSDQAAAPPGRRATSFVFGPDVVGGPSVGWARTTDFEAVCRKALRSDSTFVSAVAISGAAFASAMGRHSKGAVNSLLAASNARLGIWLPNPRYVAELAGREPEPQYGSVGPVYEGPWIARRRFSYLLKELFGTYSYADRLVYLSDGGHYENLGLVELLRRRCRLVLCFDASGDDLVTCGTFVEALALANEELDAEVRIDLSPLAPRKAATPVPGALTALDGRLSARSVVWGDITYRDGTKGCLVLAKASLTKDTPTAVLAHAARQKKQTFPNDSTGDQFFDHTQFNAYSELGRHIAGEVARVLRDEVVLTGGPAPVAVPAPPAPPVVTAPAGPRPGFWRRLWRCLTS